MRAGGRKYSPTNETFDHSLDMTARYELIEDLLVKAGSDFNIQQSNVFKSVNGRKVIAATTAYESGGMSVGFERTMSFGERGGVALDLAYVRNLRPLHHARAQEILASGLGAHAQILGGRAICGNACIAGLLVSAAIAPAGCDIFDPRAPREAGGTESNEWPWVVPSRPKDVFVNLTSGLASPLNSNYERSLDLSFTFIPSADAEAVTRGSSPTGRRRSSSTCSRGSRRSTSAHGRCSSATRT